MCGREFERLVFTLVVGVAGNFVLLPSALAQAWVAPKGEASFTLLYGNISVRDHLFANGLVMDLGRVYSNSFLFDLGYSITDRLAATVQLPYIGSRYEGAKPHQLPLDDGSNHWDFQDFRIEARYQALRGRFVLTPLVGAILPSHDYEYFGHSVVGRDIHEIYLGTAMGGRLEPILPDAYFQVRYVYSFAERVLGLSHDRSILDLELGYFIIPSLKVFAVGAGQKTHGGLDFTTNFRKIWTAEQFHHHDQVSRTDMLDVGGGVAFSATGNVDLFASWIKTLAGQNGHAIHGGLSLGASVGFSPTQFARKMHRRGPPPTGPDP